MSIKILKAIRLCIGSQCSSARMNSDICPNLGIPPISRAAAFRTGKTQFIWVGGRVQLSKIDLSILLERFPGVLFSTTVRDFGVTLDQELTLSRHVGSVCRSCFYHLRQIRSVRRSLTFKAARTLMHAFICSRVDYYSAIYAGVALAHVDQLQSVLTRELIVLGSPGMPCPSLFPGPRDTR